MMNEKYNKDREKPPCAAEWRRNPMGRQEPIGVFDSGVGNWIWIKLRNRN